MEINFDLTTAVVERWVISILYSRSEINTVYVIDLWNTLHRRGGDMMTDKGKQGNERE